LRLLETRRFKRIGGITDISVDVRIVAATNKNLRKAVESGHFRDDLYYRLNVIPIALPPLRERREDIMCLSQHFINIYNKEFNKCVTHIKKESGNHYDTKLILKKEFYPTLYLEHQLIHC